MRTVEIPGWLRRLLRLDPPPAPELPRTLYGRITVRGADGQVLPTAIVTVTRDDGAVFVSTLILDRFTVEIPVGEAYGWGGAIVIEAPGYVTPAPRRVVLGNEKREDPDLEWGDLTLFKPVSLQTRRGLVRAIGRAFVDDTGPFLPLGATLLWALYGWKFERERVIQNIAYYGQRQQAFDYIRILCQVNWPGRAIAPSWPEYDHLLGELIDHCYDHEGLRVQLTLCGGGPVDAMDLAFRVAAVVNAGRAHKVFAIETANEAFQNFTDEPLLIQVATHLRKTTPNLVATSAPSNAAFLNVLTQNVKAGTTVSMVHLDRTMSDEGWRMVRQVWDIKDLKGPTSQNEPCGPGSSVAACSDPMLLSMARAGGIMCGAGAYVVHNAAGVYGVPDPSKGRTANVWEMPGIDDICRAVKGVGSLLPPDMPNWTPANAGWTPPLPVSPFDVSGDLNKCYSATGGDSFVVMPLGVRTCDLRAKRRVEMQVYDPVTRQPIAALMLPAGQSYTCPSSSSGRGFIVLGRYL